MRFAAIALIVLCSGCATVQPSWPAPEAAQELWDAIDKHWEEADADLPEEKFDAEEVEIMTTYLDAAFERGVEQGRAEGR